MSLRSLALMRQRATILRPNMAVETATIRDRVLQSYTTVATNVPCYFEHVGTEIVPDLQLGQVAVDRFSAFFPADTDVKINDVIQVDGADYQVVGVLSYARQGFHKQAACTLKNFHRS
jgi:hypothetical protein